MTIDEIKALLGVSQLSLNEDKNEEEKSTGWFSQWFNDERVRVIMPTEAVMAVQAGDNPNLGLLDPQVKEGPKGKYTLKTIVAYKADVVM
ncbi:MAG: hypothetical protein KUG81_01465 [Gammaproteobacteria bacterium]|nr:hypothetical protein [Gammaproteobacteria bacterium]